MKNLKQNNSLKININKDDAELNDFLYCWDKFNDRPNKIVIQNNYSGSLFIEEMKKHSSQSTVVIEVAPSEQSIILNEKVFSKIDDNIYCSYVTIDKKSENSIVSDLVFYYSEKKYFEKIQNIIENLNSCLLTFCEEQINNLNTLSLGQNGVELEPLETTIDLDCFELFYAKKTMKEINKVIKDIKKSKSGLSVLYGERGTGKSSFVNYLASKLDRIVIFIPNNMIEATFNNSDFRKFLKRYDRPVIVIDDCEMMFSEFFTKSNIFSNNLLQLVDGLLSETVEVNVVTIFNLRNENEIDHSLLECNNLLKIVEFEKLSNDEATELSEHLGHNKKIKTKSKLIDIIRNKDTNDYSSIGL